MAAEDRPTTLTIAALMGSPSYENTPVSQYSKKLPDPSATARIYTPKYRFIRGREDGGELFNQMGSIACFLQLIDHPGHDFIVDAIGVDLGNALGTWGRWWRIVIGRPSATLRSLREGNIFGGG